jgi:hypothetical protein
VILSPVRQPGTARQGSGPAATGDATRPRTRKPPPGAGPTLGSPGRQRRPDGRLLEIGRRLVEFGQGAQARAEYGEALLKRLAQDLTARNGRGFGAVNLGLMRRFYLAWPAATILQTPSETSDPVPAPAGQPPARWMRAMSVATDGPSLPLLVWG